MTAEKARIPAVGLLLLAVVAWGGGMDVPAHAAPKVKIFNLEEKTAVTMNSDMVFKFKGRVRPKYLNFEEIDVRDEFGERPLGTFVRGTPLLDPDSGTYVVIDPDALGEGQLAKIEKKAGIHLVPREIRYDLGATSNINGQRLMLMDRSKKKRKYATFLTNVPLLPDLTDAAYQPGRTYTVEVAGKKPGKLRYSTWFSVAGPFAQFHHGGAPFNVVYTDPTHNEVLTNLEPVFWFRFSKPIDPRTLEGSFSLNITSQPGRPEILFTTLLRQTRTGTVEVKLTPTDPLPVGEWFEVVIGQTLKDLGGEPIELTIIAFSTAEP